MMKLYKRYVNVVVLIQKDGSMKPLMLVWDNGIKYPIDAVKEVKKAASQVGGCGILYKCMIEGKERNLFYERDRWFIESYKP